MSVGIIQLKVENVSQEQTLAYQEILSSLIASGALALKNGKAILHFDSEGVFQGCQVEYWAFKRRKQ